MAMPALLIPSPNQEEPHLLRLPNWEEAGDPVAEVEDALLLEPHHTGVVTLISGHWPLRVRDFERLIVLLDSVSLSLEKVCGREEGAMVAAAGLGLAVDWALDSTDPDSGIAWPSSALSQDDLSIHRGTLRSGDHRRASGSLLVLGDVNPGAQVTAAGHVMVWGRLRGTAHAGHSGDRTATVVALHLHPIQIRIADQVARGPAEAPPAGLAEKAHLVDGRIQIDPADPFWTLAGVPAKQPGQPEA
ncbi:MAG: septum site-determining protein MinC [Cyanobacteriota bacterium]|jgi:septum site-determining protein MinC